MTESFSLTGTTATIENAEAQRLVIRAQAGANTAPSLSGLIPNPVFDENDVNATPALIAAGAVLTDPDGNFDGGSVSVSGVLGEDLIGVRDTGTAAGAIGVAGNTISYGGVEIGTLSGGDGSTLTVTFNAAASTAAVQALINNLTYATNSDTPHVGRILTLQVTDAAGATLHTGASTFQAVGADMPYAVDEPQDIFNPAFADLNSDGVLDLVLGTVAGTLNAYTRGADGTLTKLEGARNPFAAVNVNSFAAPAFVDLDGDGRLDLVVAGDGAGLHSYHNNGSGSFTELTGVANPFASVSSAGTHADLAFVDVDNDGDMDLVTTTLTGFRYYTNAGGVFTRQASGDPFTALGIESPGGLTFLDVDGDGKKDLVVRANDDLQVAHNNGDGTFTLLSGVANPLAGMGALVDRPQAVDFDGDGDADIVYGLTWGGLNGLRNDAPSDGLIALSVAPQNDKPITSDTVVTVTEDSSHAFSAADFPFDDKDGNTLAGVVIVWLPGAGTLTLAGEEVHAGQFVAAADLASLVYTAAAGASGPAGASIAFRVQDSGDFSGEGNLSDTHVVTFDLTPVNDAPTFSLPAVSIAQLTSDSDVYGSYTMQSATAGGRFVLVNTNRPLDPQTDTDQDNDLYLYDRTNNVFTRLQTPDGQGIHHADRPVISPDGSKIAFMTNDALLPDDTNGVVDFYVLDLSANTLVRANLRINGNETYESSGYDDLVFSPDGTMLLFSTRQGLYGGDGNNDTDVYLKDLVTGEIAPVSVGSNGNTLNTYSLVPFFSPDGTKVGFATRGAFTPDDANDLEDVYLRDITTGEITRITVGPGGADLPFDAYREISLSPDGGTLLFTTYVDSKMQVYALDLATGVSTIVSAAADGTPSNNFTAAGGQFLPDGVHVLFRSDATNLINDNAPANSVGAYLKNLLTGEITRLSVDAEGHPLRDAWSVLGIANGGTQLIVGSQHPLTPGAPDYGTGELYLISLDTLPARYVDGHAAVTIAPGVQIRDVDSANFEGGTLTVAITANGEADDWLAVSPTAIPGGAIEFGETQILFHGVAIGTYDLGQSLLTFHLEAGATPAALTALAQTIGFISGSSAPSEATRTITFTLDDGDGGVSSFTREVLVVDTNNAPTSADTSVTLIEDGAYHFTGNEFAFADMDGDTQQGVVFGTPSDGVVTLDGITLYAGQFVAAADLGRLVYTPNADGAGAGYASLAFQVRDSGGTSEGGSNLSDVHTISFDVTPVNDAPVFQTTPALANISEMRGISGSDFNFGGVSPDGTLIAFFTDQPLVAGDTDESSDLYLYNRASGDIIRLTDGGGVGGDIYEAHFSPDGSKISFQSTYDSLVPGDTNGVRDLFVVDVATGVITRASEGADGVGVMPDDSSYFDSAFSPDGTLLAFSASYDGLVAGDDNATNDVFIKNLLTGAIERVSLSLDGQQLYGPSYSPFFSPDGKTLGFVSVGAIDPGDPAPEDTDLYLRDMATGVITRVVLPDGLAAGSYYNMAFSADGGKILFTGDNPLVAGDTNESSDIYLLDLASNTLSQVSTSAAGTPGDGYAYGGLFLPDGTHVLFYSNSSNLIPAEGLTDHWDGLFLKDLVTGEVTRVSANADGTPSPAYWNVVGITDHSVLLTSYDPLLDGEAADYSNDLYELTTKASVAAYVDGKGPIAVAPGVGVGDVDSDDFQGGSLTVAVTAGGEAGDQLLVREDATEGVGIHIVGTTILFYDTVVGTQSATPGGIAIQFTNDVPSFAVEALVQAIQFTNTSTLPSETLREITFTLNDGDGGTSTMVREVSVDEISNAPTADGSTIRFDEGGAHTVTLADFGFDDGAEGDALVAVVIDTLPDSGTLLYMGSPVTSNMAIPAEDIIQGLLSYQSAGWGTAYFAFHVIDDGGTADGGSDTSAPGTILFDVVRVNDDPVLTLNYKTGAVTTVEMIEGSFTRFASTGTIVDDSPSYQNGTLTVSVAGATSDDVLRIGTGGVVSLVDHVVRVGGIAIGSWTGGAGADLVISFNEQATLNGVARVLQALEYGTLSDTPPDSRTITVTVTDGEGGASEAGTATITITAVDDLPVAHDDTATVAENGTVVIAILANETDVDGGAGPALGTINGVSSVSAGASYTLDSGAKVTLNANGTLTYDPNGAYNWLVSQATAAATGASSSSATDHFSYTLSNGSRASVDILVTGVNGAGDQLRGTSGNNALTGLAGVANYFDLSQGGDDIATGSSANDLFFMGAAMTGGDRIDGGAGANDQIGLQGEYTGARALVLSPDSIAGIETIAALPGFSYDITALFTQRSGAAPLTIYGSTLGAGDNLTFNGSFETAGGFVVYGGLGHDNIVTGAANDAVYFGRDGRFDPLGDTVDGGAGTDQLALDGSYTLTITRAAAVNVETLVLLDGSAAPADYRITLADDWTLTTAEQTEEHTVYAVGVRHAVYVDGSNESDSLLRFYGGSGDDTLIGGAAGNWFDGGTGADTMTAGAGGDTFYYGRASNSMGVMHDTIVNFDATRDKIDLTFAVTGIDAAKTGVLTTAHFDADLTAALGDLGVHHAVQFTAQGGALDGRIFEVIDANGVAGYQAGQDMVIELVTPVADIATVGGTGVFI